MEGWKTFDCVRANTVQRHVAVQAHSIWRSLISHTSHPPAHGARRLRTLETPLLNTLLAFPLRGKEEVRLGALSTGHSAAYISFFHRTSLQFYTPLRIYPCSGAMHSTPFIGPATAAATVYSPNNTILSEPSDGLQERRCNFSRSVDLVTAAAENGNYQVYKILDETLARHVDDRYLSSAQKSVIDEEQANGVFNYKQYWPALSQSERLSNYNCSPFDWCLLCPHSVYQQRHKAATIGFGKIKTSLFLAFEM